MRFMSKTLLFLALLTGCASQSATVSTTPPTDDAAPETSEPVAEAVPVDVSGRYVGAYECPQGKTGLTLSIEQFDGGRLEAVFEFGPHPTNPDVPDGSFRMRGATAVGDRVRLEATEEDWIEQPEGYVTVDLQGQLVGAELSGEIINPECSVFHVVRAD